MQLSKTWLVLCVLGLAAAQSGGPAAVLVSPDTTKWEKEKNGSESITLREDALGTELLVRYPAGHVFAPHWHSSNERMVVLEGRMSVEAMGEKRSVGPGGYAFLPAKQVQRLACVSDTRCAFYVHWDGKLDFHRE